MRDSALPFDLRSLEVFLAVCDQGTMAAAARTLGVTQPAVSKTVSDLEQGTRTALFDRDVRPLGLTPAGAVLRQRASALLADARQIVPLLRETRHGKLPIVRVGFVDSLSRALMPELSASLSDVSDYVSLVWGLTANHADAILSRRLDIFVGIDDVDLLEGLDKWPLIQEPYIVVTPPDVTEVRQLEDLAAISESKAFIRYSLRTKVGREVERHLRRVGLELPRTQEFDIPYGVTAAVAEGSGWGISTPLCVFESSVPMDRLRFHPLPGPGLRRRLSLVARRQELGRLPLEVATFSRGLLKTKVLPLVEEAMPWVMEQVVIGDAPGAASL